MSPTVRQAYRCQQAVISSGLLSGAGSPPDAEARSGSVPRDAGRLSTIQ
jgi:hypothetical protein